MATDNFNRTPENPIAAPWVSGPGSAGPVLAGGTDAAGAGNSVNNVAYYTGAASTGDQYSEVTWLVTALECGPAVRCQAALESCYVFDCDVGGNGYLLRLVDSGAPVQLGATFGGATNGQVIRVEIVGTTLTAKIAGATITTRSDANLSTGQPGIFFFSDNASTRLDDWSGGDLVVTPPLTPVYVYPRWRKV